MADLVLRPGGILELHYCDERYDVSESAVEYLFELTHLNKKVHVRDIYLLLKRNPGLFPVLRRFHAQELVADAFSGTADPYLATYDPEGIEYFELSRLGFFDVDTDTYSPMNHLDFPAIGWELREPFVTDQEHRAVGQRRNWDYYFASPREILNYPLRFTETCEVWRRGFHSQSEFVNVSFGPAMLGQIIEAVIGRWVRPFEDANDETDFGRKKIGPLRGLRKKWI